MPKLNEKQKLIAIAGAGLGVCLLAGGGVWWAKGLIDDVQKQIDAKKAEIVVAEQKIAKIKPTENEVIILRELLDEYIKILPDSRDVITFTKMLSQFEQQSGIQVNSYTPARMIKAPGKSAERFTRVEYQYEMTATLWQFMRFISSIENYERIVSIKDFAITAAKGKGNKGAVKVGEDLVHEMKLSLETYTYNGKGQGQDVEIPEYDEKRDALREEIVKRLVPLKQERYEHRGSLGRRDIFVDPREDASSGPGIGTDLAVQQKILGDYTKEITEVQALLASAKKADTVFEQFGLQKQATERIGKMEAGIEEIAQKGLLTSQGVRFKWAKEVVEPLKAMRDQLSGAQPANGGSLYLSLADTQELVSMMKKSLLAGDLEEARARYEAIAPKLNPDPADRCHELVVQARVLRDKAVTALDFRNLELKIQGVLVNHGGRSGVLLNNEVYEEGEYVSDELFVSKVEEEQIHFVFRGLTLIRTL